MSEIQRHKPKSKKFNAKLAELIAILTWLYFTIKFLFIDFDVFLIQRYLPEMNWIIKYKFFVFIVIVLILWILLKGEYLLKLIGYILGYPVFLLFWRIPKLLFRTKNWIGIFAALEIIISLFKKIKFNFVVFTCVAISCLLILVTSSPYTLIPSTIFLFGYLIIYFISRFKYAFHPFSTLTVQSDALTKIWINIQDKFRFREVDSNEKKEENTDKKGRDPQWAMNLQFVLIINKICYFLMSKLRNFKRSKIAVLYSILSIVGSVFITIIVFSFINFAIYKLSPSSFSNPNLGRFVYFLYYSFNTIFTNSINDFYPTGDIARLINCIEIFFGFIILVILFFLLTTILKEKHNEQIDGVISAVDSQATMIERFIEDEYKLSPIQALKEIEKVKGSMLKIIYYFINSIE